MQLALDYAHLTRSADTSQIRQLVKELYLIKSMLLYLYKGFL